MLGLWQADCLSWKRMLFTVAQSVRLTLIFNLFSDYFSSLSKFPRNISVSYELGSNYEH